MGANARHEQVRRRRVHRDVDELLDLRLERPVAPGHRRELEVGGKERRILLQIASQDGIQWPRASMNSSRSCLRRSSDPVPTRRNLPIPPPRTRFGRRLACDLASSSRCSQIAGFLPRWGVNTTFSRTSTTVCRTLAPKNDCDKSPSGNVGDHGRSTGAIGRAGKHDPGLETHRVHDSRTDPGFTPSGMPHRAVKRISGPPSSTPAPGRCSATERRRIGAD